LGSTKQFWVEALIRWNNSTLGFMSPEKFIALAQERGLIYELGGWVIETPFIQ
jgi:EAL domain-containing protein (putative c-di-GMP-specific phosphodiesterase class I)